MNTEEDQGARAAVAAAIQAQPVSGPLVSVSEWTLGDRNTAIIRASRAGFTAFEPDAGPRQEWAELHDRLRASNLATPSLCWRWNEDAELGSPDAASRGSAQRYLAEALEQAVAFGADRVVVVPVCRAQPYEDDDAEDALRRAAQSIREVLVDAPSAVGIALEALHREESYLMNRLEQADRLRCEIDDRRVSLLADSYHMFHEEVSAEDALFEHRRHIGLVHLAARDRSYPRRGDAEVEGFLRTVISIGFRGSMTIECVGATDDDLIQALESVKTLAQAPEDS